MANESRRRNNNVQGTLGSTMSVAATTMKGTGLANLEAISSTEHAVIVIDPGRTAGAPEIVYVTAHTAASTKATVVRGREGTSARTHSSTEQWIHGPTVQDWTLAANPPRAQAYRDAAQSVVENVWTPISFDTETFDSDAMWSSTAPERFICKTAGTYSFSFQGAFAASTGGTVRAFGIQVNSTTANPRLHDIRRESPSASFDVRGGVTVLVPLTTGQYVRAMQFHDHSTTLNTSTAAGTVFGPTCSMLWVSP